MAQIRYIVNDVNEAVAFYTEELGFSLKQQYGPAMAIMEYQDIQLWVAGPAASASKPMPDGTQPVPGGWARFVLPVENIQSVVDSLSAAGIGFRNEIVEGPGGKQILCLDPSGNVIELFEANKT